MSPPDFTYLASLCRCVRVVSLQWLRTVAFVCVVPVIATIAINFLFVWTLDYIRGDLVWRLNVEKCSFVCMLRHGDDTIGRYVDFPRQSCTCMVEVGGFQHIKE